MSYTQENARNRPMCNQIPQTSVASAQLTYDPVCIVEN